MYFLRKDLQDKLKIQRMFIEKENKIDKET